MFVEVREQLCGVCWVPETQAPCLYCKNLTFAYGVSSAALKGRTDFIIFFPEV